MASIVTGERSLFSGDGQCSQCKLNERNVKACTDCKACNVTLCQNCYEDHVQGHGSDEFAKTVTPAEIPVCQARANVMTYDDMNRKWIASGSSPGLSKVQIYRHTVNNTFRVVGRKLQDHEVVINCAILKNLKYNQATPTFHQWRDSRHVYGLNFANKEDSETFANAMLAALDTLNNQGRQMTAQMAPPMAPQNPPPFHPPAGDQQQFTAQPQQQNGPQQQISKVNSEIPVCQARANVMTYDDMNRKWIPSGSSPGLSKVQIYRHTVNNTFRVVGRKLQDYEVVINCAILKNLKYDQATPTFHQWRDSRHVYGLSFANKEDSETFANAMLAALDTLNSKDKQESIIGDPSKSITWPRVPTCQICQDRYCDTFLDCGHILCYVCSCELEKRGAVCHVCRMEFKEQRKLYY